MEPYLRIISNPPRYGWTYSSCFVFFVAGISALLVVTIGCNNDTNESFGNIEAKLTAMEAKLERLETAANDDSTAELAIRVKNLEKALERTASGGSDPTIGQLGKRIDSLERVLKQKEEDQDAKDVNTPPSLMDRPSVFLGRIQALKQAVFELRALRLVQGRDLVKEAGLALEVLQMQVEDLSTADPAEAQQELDDIGLRLDNFEVMVAWMLTTTRVGTFETPEEPEVKVEIHQIMTSDSIGMTWDGSITAASGHGKPCSPEIIANALDKADRYGEVMTSLNEHCTDVSNSVRRRVDGERPNFDATISFMFSIVKNTENGPQVVRPSGPPNRTSTESPPITTPAP